MRDIRFEYLKAGSKITETYPDTKYIWKQKWHTLWPTNIYKNIFSLKSAEKHEYSASAEKKNSYTKTECILFQHLRQNHSCVDRETGVQKSRLNQLKLVIYRFRPA